MRFKKETEKNIMRMTHEAIKGLEEDTRLLPIYPKQKKKKKKEKKKKKMMLFCQAQPSCSRKNPQTKVIEVYLPPRAPNAYVATGVMKSL